MSSRREAAGGSQPTSSNAPRQNVYFVPRDGIDREVITADICRYLGNDALVRPGTYQVCITLAAIDPMLGQHAHEHPNTGPEHWPAHAGLPHHSLQKLDIRTWAFFRCDAMRSKAKKRGQAMIQSLKEDSARWDTERRSRTAGTTNPTCICTTQCA